MKTETKIILIVAVIVVLLSQMGTMNSIFFGAIEDVPTCKEWTRDEEGQKVCKTFMTCTKNKDCEFCLGKMFVNETHELKSGYCQSGKCYVSEWCINKEIVKDWLKDNPWAWIKKNVLLTLGVLVLMIFGTFAYLPRWRGKIRGIKLK